MNSLYHTLRASLDALVCPNCAGLGMLVSGKSQLHPFTPMTHRTWAARCEPCEGTGTKRPNLTLNHS